MSQATMGIKASHSPQTMGIKQQRSSHTMGIKTHMVNNNLMSKVSANTSSDMATDHDTMDNYEPLGIKKTDTHVKQSYLEKKRK